MITQDELGAHFTLANVADPVPFVMKFGHAAVQTSERVSLEMWRAPLTQHCKYYTYRTRY